MNCEEVHQTVGIITPDGEVTTTSIITNTSATASEVVGQQSKTFVLDHMYGMAVSPSSAASSSLSSSSSNNMHASSLPVGPSMRGRSKVWSEFSVTDDGKRVICQRCGESLAYSNSHSTSSMLKHLKRKHSLDLYPPVNGNEDADGSSGSIGNTSGSSNGAFSDQKRRSSAPTSIVRSSMFAEKSPQASTINKPVKKYIPKDAEENDTSIQHGPLLFKDTCVRMKWTDHSDTFLRSFSSLYSDESYTDVTIYVEKQFFKAHRLILSSASEFFDETFKITPAGQHPIVYLKDVKAMDFRILLDFIYKGEVSIPPSMIPGLVKVGSDLKVRGLSDFVWNEQLANNVFQPKPQQHQPTPQPSTPVQEALENSHCIHQTQAAPSFHTSAKVIGNDFSFPLSQNSTSKITTASPIRSLTRQVIRQPMLPSQQRQGIVLPPPQPQLFSRIMNFRPINQSAEGAGVVSGGATATTTGVISGLPTGQLCTTNVKRIRLVAGQTVLTSDGQLGTVSQISGAGVKIRTGGSNGGVLPSQTPNTSQKAPPTETVLMVTNQGETLLSTTQGGVTVLTQPNTATMAMQMNRSEMQTDDQQSGGVQQQQVITSEQEQLRPVITAITSQAPQQQHQNGNEGGEEGQQEIVYSMSELSEEGGDDRHEILMNHQEDQEMDCNTEQIESVDKKPYLQG